MDVTHQVIQYRLNPDGTIPEFLLPHKEFSGLFVKHDSSTPSPRDLIMLGISKYTVSTDTPSIVGIISTKDELTIYLNEVLAGATQPNPDDLEGEPIPIDIPAQVEWAWSIYQIENGLE